MQPNQIQQTVPEPATQPALAQKNETESEQSLRQRTVLAAKTVIAENKQNPYQLSQELYRLKAALLAEEFNIKPQLTEQ